MRVPVGDVSAGVLFEWNAFLCLAFAAAVASWALLRLARARAARLGDGAGARECPAVPPPVMELYAALLGSLAAALCCSGLLVEAYWYEGCPVSPERFDSTVAIFRRNLGFFQAQPAAWREAHPHWVAEGSLLAVVRDNPNLNRWDQDSDVFMIYDPVEDDHEAEQLLAKLRAFHGSDYSVQYNPARRFIQVVHSSGGHGDIWLWQRFKRDTDSQGMLYNPDFTFSSFRATPNFIIEDWVVPTRTRKWPPPGGDMQPFDLPVPKMHPKVLADQYGPGYMTPYRNRLQCVENFGTKTTLLRKLVSAALVAGAALGTWMWMRRRPQTPQKDTGKAPAPLNPRICWLLAAAALVAPVALHALSSGSGRWECPRGMGTGGGTQLISPKQLRLWHREGMLQIRKAMAAEEVDALRGYLDELVAMPTVAGGVWKYFETNTKNSSQKLINRIEKFTDYHAGLKELTFSPGVLGRAAELLGCPVALFKEKVNFKMPGGGGFEPHQDMQPGWDVYAPQMLTVLLVVDYNSVANGCLEVAPGSHARPGGLIGRMHEPLNATETMGLKWVPLEALPGDMIFFDAWAPHRSAPNNSTVPRRNTYITFNCAQHGDHRQVYYADKFKGLPPDADRKADKNYRYKV
eukprot:TRINITY_DN60541_c0_g1_i1.p1 TRINITY_DN60541_c0_g1~~TRINITY_DN60541_c0_g1_i1.p1  ORF type:complete len:654 (+),score=232.74 TRINITY_DN60541_c0_g1_i1:72-1964(+)